MRAKTKEKEIVVLNAFWKLLRCGKDYTVEYMYREAGRVCFLEPKTAGDIVRRYYGRVISDDMIEFIQSMMNVPYLKQVDQFSIKYKKCTRESRFIIRYIKRRITNNKKT